MDNTGGRKRKLSEDIVDRLVEQIQTKELQIGNRLPSERELAEIMGVSRPVIREALRSLESMGYVSQRIGAGTYVTEPTMSTVVDRFSALTLENENLDEELLEVRMILETATVRMAARNRSGAHLAALKKNLELFTADIEAGENGVEHDYEFHKLIARASGNRTLFLLYDMCADLLLRTQSITQHIPGQPLRTLQDHRGIYSAVQLRDCELARELMIAHLSKARDNLQSSREVVK